MLKPAPPKSLSHRPKSTRPMHVTSRTAYWPGSSGTLMRPASRRNLAAARERTIVLS
ncbi:hypothetical protein MYFR107205_15560 [Mycolicibacterium frederiksbergense]